MVVVAGCVLLSPFRCASVTQGTARATRVLQRTAGLLGRGRVGSLAQPLGLVLLVAKALCTTTNNKDRVEPVARASAGGFVCRAPHRSCP